MAATQITPEQVIQLTSFPRHQELCKQWVRDTTVFLRTLTGEDANRAGKSPKLWATQRMIAGRIANHPNAQDYQEWCTQMTVLLKGQTVWENSLDGTVDFLATNNKYEEIANLVYELRADREEF